MIFEYNDTLEERYHQCCTKRGDIHEHIPTLLRYGKDVNIITELGVRTGGSTSAWVKAAPKKLICYDINQRPDFHLSQYEKWAEEQGIDFEFILADTTKIEIEPTELLFIDTLHTYDQLKTELTLHGNKASKYIILHDTVSFAYRGMVTGTKGLIPAIEEFLTYNHEWRMKVHYKNCNGLMVLERTKT